MQKKIYTYTFLFFVVGFTLICGMEVDSQTDSFDWDGLAEPIKPEVLSYVDLPKEMGANLNGWDSIRDKEFKKYGVPTPDGKYNFLAESGFKLYSSKGVLLAQWGWEEGLSEDNKYRLDLGPSYLRIYTSEGELLTGDRWVRSGGCLGFACLKAGSGRSEVTINMPKEESKEFMADMSPVVSSNGHVFSNCFVDVAWSPNDECLMVVGSKKLWLKNIKNGLLLQEAPKDLNITQYLFLLTLLRGSFPFYINETGKETLDSIPEIKKLLRIQKGRHCDIWRLLMKKYDDLSLRCDW